MRKIKIFWLVAVLIVFFLNVPLIVESKTPLLEKDHENDCLPQSEFGLNNLRMGDSEIKVRKIFGKPQKIKQADEVDDGGPYIVYTYYYNKLEVDIVREKVDRLLTSAHKESTTSGIHPGLTLKEVINILGREPKEGFTPDKEYIFRTCPELIKGEMWDANYMLYFKFNEQKVLVSVKLIADRP